jgi:uncharacterized membrane protein YfcA
LEYLIICAAALIASGLTLFSGFGLGTILTPVFTLFFPVPVAVAATAVVHLANNLFKLALVGRSANKKAIFRFAVPAVFAALIGASLLAYAGSLPVLTTYALGGHNHEITVVKLTIGLIIIVFSLFELLPRFKNISFDQKYMTVGGLLSGFFGGISGIQGALRSMFLLKAGLEKEEFIGTNVVSAVIVDLGRLLVYGAGFYSLRFKALSDLSSRVLAATAAAFLGAFIGARMVKKVTLSAVQAIVGVMLILLGIALSLGLI